MPSANESIENSVGGSAEKRPIRVLAADSTRMNTQMLADVLARDKRFCVLTTQISAGGILTAAERDKPDVILLSPVLEDDSARGYALARELRSLYPSVRIIMLLDRSERNSAVDAFRAGASGIFCRSESLKFLPRCIACVHAGQVWANSGELKYLLDALAEAMPRRSIMHARDVSVLSKREQDVVRGVADGLSNREIAQQLCLTEHTVKNYLFRIFDKLGVSSRVEVVLYAFGLESAVSQDRSISERPTRERAVTAASRVRKRPRATSRHSDEVSAVAKPARKALPI
jgi:two-component system, NarL family, nitrate/nitrite response regulator NarL